MLEHQVRTARALLDELRERRSPVTQTSMSLVVDCCAVLRAEAAEVVKASEMLQGEACGPGRARWQIKRSKKEAGHTA